MQKANLYNSHVLADPSSRPKRDTLGPKKKKRRNNRPNNPTFIAKNQTQFNTYTKIDNNDSNPKQYFDTYLSIRQCFSEFSDACLRSVVPKRFRIIIHWRGKGLLFVPQAEVFLIDPSTSAPNLVRTSVSLNPNRPTNIGFACNNPYAYCVTAPDHLLLIRLYHSCPFVLDASYVIRGIWSISRGINISLTYSHPPSVSTQMSALTTDDANDQKLDGFAE